MKTLSTMSLVGVAAATLTSVGFAADLPARPEQIEFQPLHFDPPNPVDYRHELSSGVPVYMAQSREFPLVTITFSFKGGDYLDPADHVGLARMTAAMIRRGGTESVSASDLDEQFDFLAANVSTNAGPTRSTASLNSMTNNLDAAFALFMDMIRHPAFQEDKVALYKKETLERMKQRNDDASRILSREWGMMLYGEDHFEGRRSTAEGLDSVTVADMHAFQNKVFQPGNLIIGVTGDFDTQDMLDRLEQAVSGWERRAMVSDPPAPTHVLTPGVFYIEKDIPQGKVDIGQRGITRDDPDYFPMLIMNDILGGGGFTSRLVSRVRSDEGLAYSVGSRLSTPVYFPGAFRASFQSKNRTVALAAKIIMEEIARIRSEPVTDEELGTSKNSFIETFPRRFESKQAIINTFLNDEWTGRAPDYWATYRDKVRAVTADDVLRVAKAHLHPDKMAMLIVGKWSEIAPGDLDGRASMADFFGGVSAELPLRDPLTLKPMQ